eukprot:366093-Chlamydomonas_euryale.AAC.5
MAAASQMPAPTAGEISLKQVSMPRVKFMTQIWDLSFTLGTPHPSHRSSAPRSRDPRRRSI